MWIFDRWGNNIYYTQKLDKPWDGKANGGPKVAQEDVYVWMIQTRERLRSRFSRVLARVCRHWQERGEETRARALQEKCLEIEPLAEFKATVSDR